MESSISAALVVERPLVDRRRRFCAFCCKESESSESNVERLTFEENIRARFVKLVSRQLHSSKRRSKHPVNPFEDYDLKSCLDCFAIIEGYCELYDQIKSLELRLNWQVEKLENVMRFADRVPSRFKKFREWCNGNGEEGLKITAEALNINDVRNSPERGSLIYFRRAFKRKCKLYKSTTLPRIILNDCNGEIEDRSVSKCMHPSDIATPLLSILDPELDTDNHLISNVETYSNAHKSECFLGWITSLTAIIFLFHFAPGNELLRSTRPTSETLSFPEPGCEYQKEEEVPVSGQSEIDTTSLHSYSEESSHSESNEDDFQEASTIKFAIDVGEIALTKQEIINDSVHENEQTLSGGDNKTANISGSEEPGTGPSCSFAQSHNGVEKMIVEDGPFPYQYENEVHSKYEVDIVTMKHPVWGSSSEPVEGHDTGNAIPSPTASIDGSLHSAPSHVPVQNTLNGNELIPLGTLAHTQNQSACQIPSTSSSKASRATQKSKISPVPVQSRERISLRRKFQCPTCQATFSSSGRLEEHLSTFHEESNDMDSSDDGDDNGTGDNAMEDDADWADNGNASSRQKTFLSNNEIDLKAESESDDKLTSESDSEPGMEKELVSMSFRKGNEGSFVCSKCTPNMRFSGRRKLRLHYEYFHSNGHLFLQKSWLRKLKIHHLKLDNFPSKSRHHPCPHNECGKVFTQPAELDNHGTIYHSEYNFTCQFCDLTINSAVDLIDHELEHSDAKQLRENKDFKKGEHFACGRCDSKKTSKIKLKNHYLQEHLEMPPIQATCPICKQIFKNVEQVPLTHYVNFHDLARLEDPVKPFRCSQDAECPAYFLTEDQLHIHWNKFHQTAGAQNNIASIIGAEEKKLRKEKWDADRKTQACRHCAKTFISAHDLRMHIWSQHGKGKDLRHRTAHYINSTIISAPEDGITIEDLLYDKNAKYFCCVESCKRGFMEEGDLTLHSKLHGEFKCNYCEVVKIFAPDLSIHETVHSVGGTHSKKSGYAFQCVRCSFVTNKKESYMEHHLDEHLGLIMDKKRCPICKYAYSWNMLAKRNNGLADRMLSHYVNYHEMSEIIKEDGDAEEVVHKCDRDECKAYFRTTLQLHHHVLEVHENLSRDERFKCADCGKCFPKAMYLTLHRTTAHKVFTEDFQFVCKVPGCSKRFEREIDLENHDFTVHVQCPNQLECPEKCGKMFWTKAALKNHLRGYAHRGGRPANVCEECGKSFKQKFQLEIHMQFHAGPETWKFSCSVCNKKIISQQKLNEHMRTHTKEKPFVCQVCGVSYAHRHNLRIHVNNKHGLQDIAKKYDRSSTTSSRKGKKIK